MSTQSVWDLGQRILDRTGPAAVENSVEGVECVGNVRPKGNADVWYREWTVEGERFFARGCLSEGNGDLADAKQAYASACICYRTSYLPFLGQSADPWLADAFHREADAFARVARCSDPPLEVTSSRVENATLLVCFARSD